MNKALSNNSASSTSSAYYKKNPNKKEGLNFKLAFKVIRKYLGFYKKSVLIAFLLSLVATAFNILAIIGLGDLQTMFSTIIVRGGTQVVSEQWYLTFAGLLIVYYFINAFVQWIMNLVVIRLAQGAGYKLRMDLFNKVQILSVKYFDTHESGDMMSVLTNDVYNIVQFVSQNLTQTLYGIATMLGMLILMFIISPVLGAMIMGILIILLSLVFILIKKSGPAFIGQQRQLGEINGYIEEKISGQNIINFYKQQNTVQNEFQEINIRLTKSSKISQSISGLLIPWLNFLTNFTFAIAYGVGFTMIINNVSFYGAGVAVTLDKSLTDTLYQIPGEAGRIAANMALLTSFTLASRNFVSPINQIIAMVSQMNLAVAGCTRADEILVQQSEFKPFETKEVETDLKGKVEIKDLSFSYVEGKPVLKNVNITALPGQTIAIVGPTGSGKTTIINLLTKFYDIEEGDILIDGYDIKTLTKQSMRKQVSIVLQDTYLFSGTIIENIRLAKPDATDEEIKEVARLADCEDFILKLENGYDTVLSENASELSSGQKQLIAIARAMISPSSILILDEATSNVDTRTEKIVQGAMLKLIKNKTSFVIAHRLSTVRNADKIVVLKDGMVLETGNHKDLMKLKGFYYNLNMSKTDNLDVESD